MRKGKPPFDLEAAVRILRDLVTIWVMLHTAHPAPVPLAAPTPALTRA